MPIYTYRCENCGVRFDRQQSFSDQPLTRCPECGKKTLRKVYLPVGIVFKGSGFYATDHRSPSGSSRSSSKDEKSGSNEKSGSDDKPADSKKEGESSASTSTESKEKKS
jgi:putative FmdB family regulatory protein